MSGAGAVGGCVFFSVASLHCHCCGCPCVDASQKVVVVLKIALRCELEDVVTPHARIPLRHVDAAVDIKIKVADSVDTCVKEVDHKA